MDRPFREIHELYKILYQRAEAQAAAEAKRREEEEKKAKEQERAKNSARVPPDAMRMPANNVGMQPSTLDVETLEEVLEDMI